MPRFRGEHDPIGDPSMLELEEEAEKLTQINADIGALNRSMGSFYREELGSPSLHPDNILDTVDDIQNRLNDLSDVQEREQIERSLGRIRNEANLQYEHFINKEIGRFGFHKSSGRRVQISFEELMHEIEYALHILGMNKHPKAPDAIQSIKDEREWLDRYNQDPAVYRVRRRTQELDKIVPSWFFDETENFDTLEKGLSSDSGDNDQEYYFDQIRDTLKELRSSLKLINKPEMRTFMTEYSQDAVNHAESFMFIKEAPVQYIKFLVELRVIVGELKDGGELDAQKLSALKEVFDVFFKRVMRDQYLSQGLRRAAENLHKVINDLMTGKDPEKVWGDLHNKKNKEANASAAALKLGLEATPTFDEAKKTWKRLAKQHHPDMGGDENVFKEMREAYVILLEELKE